MCVLCVSVCFACVLCVGVGGCGCGHKASMSNSVVARMK